MVYFKNMRAYLKKIITYLSYLLLFLLPWQTKLILRPDFSNYNEIGLYAWEIILIILVLLFLIYNFKIIFKAPEMKKIPVYLWLLAIWELFTFVSIFVAPDKLLALNYYFLFLLGLALFSIIKSKDLDIPRPKLTLAFLLSLSFQAGLAITQFLLQTTWANKYLGLAYHNPGLAGTAVIETASGRWLRAYGGFDHPNILGGVMLIGLLSAAHYIINLPRGEREKKTETEYSKLRIKPWPTLFIWVFYLLGLMALYCSFSRTAWLAYGAALFILAIFYIKEKAWPNLGKLFALVILSTVLIFSLNSCFHELSFTRLTGQGRLEAKSVSERQEYLAQAATLIRSNYLLGVGRGNYVKSLSVNNLVTPTDYPQPVHNVFILALAEIGIFGFLSFVAWLFYTIKKTSARALGAGIFIALIILMFFDHWLWSLPFGLVFFWLVLALVW
ncbi:MAG: O-antigen ligase family protein [Candidatus Falkowbacteria bacterium]|nr:O-antigen ligase family protein [Candidatus Falkowbacteria bacterium]